MAETKDQGWSSSISRDLTEQDLNQVYKVGEDAKWVPHPLNEKVKLKYLLTKKDDGVKVTCLLARVPQGESIPEHTHQVNDILYPLTGKGIIWIQGIGELELKRGVLVNVPPGVLHKVYKITEDMEIYDVFSDAIA